MSRFLLIVLLALPWMGWSAEACVTNAECDDGSVCTGSEICQAGFCIPGTPLTCDDGNVCTVDSCDSVLGCVYTPTDSCPLSGRDMALSITTDHRFKLRTGTGMAGPAFPANNTADDPVQNGASLRVFTTMGDGFDNTYPMPGVKWEYRGAPAVTTGYTYRDIHNVYGPVALVVIREGKPAKIKARGSSLNFTLATDPSPVNVVLRFGNSGRRYCLQYGGDTKFNPGVRFQSRAAQAPTACPSP